jgi:hypothetical protein
MIGTLLISAARVSKGDSRLSIGLLALLDQLPAWESARNSVIVVRAAAICRMRWRITKGRRELTLDS